MADFNYPELKEAHAKALQDAKRFSFDLSKFSVHVARSDDMDVVIKSHLYLEHVLVQLLREEFRHPDEIDLRGLGFPTKVNLCVALGAIPASLRQAMIMLNQTRNKVAHDLGYTITNDAKERFWRALPAETQEATLAEAKLPPSEFTRLAFGSMFRALIIWIDIARQHRMRARIDERFAQENLRRVLDDVRPLVERIDTEDREKAIRQGRETPPAGD